jgi:hypothetical protein
MAALPFCFVEVGGTDSATYWTSTASEKLTSVLDEMVVDMLLGRRYGWDGLERMG